MSGLGTHCLCFSPFKAGPFMLPQAAVPFSSSLPFGLGSSGSVSRGPVGCSARGHSSAHVGINGDFCALVGVPLCPGFNMTLAIINT